MLLKPYLVIIRLVPYNPETVSLYALPLGHGLIFAMEILFASPNLEQVRVWRRFLGATMMILTRL